MFFGRSIFGCPKFINESPKMGISSADPLSSVVTLLKPEPSIAKMVEGAGLWRVERSNMASPFYCAMVEGVCLLTIKNCSSLVLEAGDFVLIPEAFDFTMSSIQPPQESASLLPLEVDPGVFYLGEQGAPIDVRCLVGHCRFASPDRAMLVSLLPTVIYARAQGRLITLVEMIQDETKSDRAARDMVLQRLLELLFVEALRCAESTKADPGLLRGLANTQLASALRQIHADPGACLSVRGLSAAAGMSRSIFFERFRNEVGLAPMEYVATWRMAVAKEMLISGKFSIVEIATSVGYGSVSSFSMAFSRHVGIPPGAFAARRGVA